MPNYPLMQVDAFTTQRLAGNACAIVFEADDLSDAQMQAIAREMNLSETSFVLRSQVADVRARYFTPAEEIPLAGHPTIATFHALLETGRLVSSGKKTAFSLELQAGVIQVDIIGTDANRYIIMTQKPPQFLSIHHPAEVLPLFGLSPEDALPNVPIQTVSTGTPQLMVAVRDLAVLQRIHVQHRAYSQYRHQSDFFSPHLFCTPGITAEGDTFARHFGTPPDTMEDPFTGSATGGMAAFLWRYGLIEKSTFIAEQGHWMQRPGQAQVEIVGTRDQIEQIRVGGQAVTVLRGELIV
jgi:trans-2,3-dihydro-3-hydroxyanthranilate isomerase